MKGFFTQGVAILLERAVTLDAVRGALSRFEIGRVNAEYEPLAWAMSGPAVILPYRPTVNGTVSVDIVDRPWPDHMGDAKTETDLFAAWSMGFFGPFAFPNQLASAREQSGLDPDAAEASRKHRAFLRVRASYVGGVDPDAPVMPADYLPLPELLFVTEIAEALLELPEALCYFNPNGATLRSRETVGKMMNDHRNGGPPPLPLWANVRVFLDEEKRGFFGGKQKIMLAETVGMEQLDVPDQLARCDPNRHTPRDATGFLLNMALYLLERGPVIQVGETAGGSAEERWKLEAIKKAPTSPPRDVYHWRAP